MSSVLHQPGGTGRIRIRFPSDLSLVSTRRLYSLSNNLYNQLESDKPGRNSGDRYYAVLDELQSRQETDPSIQPELPRATVCDNPTASQFDIYADGTVAGFEHYQLKKAEMWFLHTVISPRFRSHELAPILITSALNMAHRRRLAVLPFCPEVRKFMTAHSEYLQLVPAEHRARFRLPQRIPAINGQALQA